jgi:hypothetical protein
MTTRQSRKLKGIESVRLIDVILGAGFKDSQMPLIVTGLTFLSALDSPDAVILCEADKLHSRAELHAAGCHLKIKLNLLDGGRGPGTGTATGTGRWLFSILSIISELRL